MNSFASRLKACGFRGEICDDQATRRLNATDNSIYELMPEGVLQPYDAADLRLLVQVANEPEFKTLTFTARGGGTGTNGQSLNRGWIVDTSRYMTRVIDFNPEKREITVEPGIVLSELNRFLKPHGLFFAPSGSTADRATIGGMISTDAAGKGSLVYGKTSDHLSAIDWVMIQDKQDIDSLKQKISKILEPLQTEISARFPTLKRPLSGYNLKQAYENGQVDLNRLLAGSEGTLAFIAGATLKLLPLPKYKQLVVVQYPDFLSALKDSPFLISQGPVAIEVVDDQVQRCVDGRSYVANLVEFAEHDEKVLEQKSTALTQALKQRGSTYTVINDVAEQAAIWGIRSAAVGLVGRLPGSRKPIAFVEDAIVPPEHLCDFIVEFKALLEQHQLQYAMYGHTDVGCIHVRPALDMKQAPDRAQIRLISEAVLALTQKYQGLLWGEHGKGFRGEFVKDVFGPQLYQAMAEIKALFDPHNRLNPGKLVAPDGDMHKVDRIDAVPMRGELDATIPIALQAEYPHAMICNGNAACFNREPTNVMCPSYKVTNDRIHSPKGRAMLLKQWLRAPSKETATDVFKAMSGCLGCKGCSGKCPVQVSIPDMRSQFLETYYQRYKKRSLRDYVMGYVEDLLPLAARFSVLWNLARQLNIFKMLGLTHLPKLHLSKLNLPYHRNLDPSTLKSTQTVVLLVDVFTGILDPKVIEATYQSIKKLDLTPYILSPRASGKALVVNGFLKSFKRKAAVWAETLNPLFEAGIPVIGLENTIVLMFRDEVKKFGEQELKGKVLSLGEYFTTVITAEMGIQSSAEYTLLPHCTEQALLPSEAKAWQSIFKNLGHTLSIQNAGCCGMAGLYGYQQEHIDNSRKLFEMHWQPHLQEKKHTLLATGFSCRSQMERFGKQRIQHPVEILYQSLEGIH